MNWPCEQWISSEWAKLWWAYHISYVNKRTDKAGLLDLNKRLEEKWKQTANFALVAAQRRKSLCYFHVMYDKSQATWRNRNYISNKQNKPKTNKNKQKKKNRVKKKKSDFMPIGIWPAYNGNRTTPILSEYLTGLHNNKNIVFLNTRKNDHTKERLKREWPKNRMYRTVESTTLTSHIDASKVCWMIQT